MILGKRAAGNSKDSSAWLGMIRIASDKKM